MIGWYVLWNVFAGCLIGFAVGAVINVFVFAYFVFTVAQEERHRRKVELMETMIELEKLEVGREEASEPAEVDHEAGAGADDSTEAGGMQ